MSVETWQGRCFATFLPLTAVGSRGVFRNDDALQEPGVLGLASSLVTADEKFSGLVEYLLGRILVVDHIDHAIAVAKKYKNSLRIVTLEGELLNPGGSMSGGAYKNSSNLLSRRREMEDGELLLNELQHAWNDTKNQMEEVQFNIDAHNREIKKLQSELQDLYLEQNTSKLKYDQAKLDSENISINYKLIHQESTDIENRFTEIQNTILGLKQQMEEYEKMNREKEKEIAEFNNVRKSRVTLTEDRKQRKYTDFRELYKYLLDKYPLERIQPINYMSQGGKNDEREKLD